MDLRANGPLHGVNSPGKGAPGKTGTTGTQYPGLMVWWPAVLGPVGALITALTYAWGAKRMRTVGPQTGTNFIGGMIAGAAVGVVIVGMQVSGIIR